MHEDVPLIVCGAPGGGQRFVRPRRPGLSRAGRAVVDVSLRHSHIRYVLCLRRVLANRYAFRTWVAGTGSGPCERVCASVLRIDATRERVEDGGEDGGPATGRRTAGGGTAYQQLRARPSPRAAPSRRSGRATLGECDRHTHRLSTVRHKCTYVTNIPIPLSQYNA